MYHLYLYTAAVTASDTDKTKTQSGLTYCMIKHTLLNVITVVNKHFYTLTGLRDISYMKTAE